MIFKIQYFFDNLVSRRNVVSKHSDARQHWMIDSNQSKTKMYDRTTGGEYIYIYIFIFTRKFYNMLPLVIIAYKEIQWYFSIIYLVINQFTLVINQQRVKPLPHGTTLSAIRATALLANRPRASTRTEISRYWNLIPYYYY